MLADEKVSGYRGKETPKKGHGQFSAIPALTASPPNNWTENLKYPLLKSWDHLDWQLEVFSAQVLGTI